jgi:hypothetical protein
MLRFRLFSATVTACQPELRLSKSLKASLSVATWAASGFSPGIRTVKPWLLAVSRVSTMCR